MSKVRKLAVFTLTARRHWPEERERAFDFIRTPNRRTKAWLQLRPAHSKAEGFVQRIGPNETFRSQVSLSCPVTAVLP